MTLTSVALLLVSAAFLIASKHHSTSSFAAVSACSTDSMCRCIFTQRLWTVKRTTPGAVTSTKPSACTAVRGSDGRDGRDGSPGPRGPPGRDGRDGLVGPQGLRGSQARIRRCPGHKEIQESQAHLV